MLLWLPLVLTLKWKTISTNSLGQATVTIDGSQVVEEVEIFTWTPRVDVILTEVYTWTASHIPHNASATLSKYLNIHNFDLCSSLFPESFPGPPSSGSWDCAVFTSVPANVNPLPAVGSLDGGEGGRAPVAVSITKPERGVIEVDGRRLL